MAQQVSEAKWRRGPVSWINGHREVQTVQGWVCGAFGAYKTVLTTRTYWHLTHMPTGYALGVPRDTLTEARNAADQLSALDIDWAAIKEPGLFTAAQVRDIRNVLASTRRSAWPYWA